MSLTPLGFNDCRAYQIKFTCLVHSIPVKTGSGRRLRAAGTEVNGGGSHEAVGGGRPVNRGRVDRSVSDSQHRVSNLNTPSYNVVAGEGRDIA